MNWSDQVTRIRKWIRDPAGNVFSDAFLLRLYNDEQQQFFQQLGVVADIKAVRTHPGFYGAYVHECDWPYTDHTSGDVYQVGLYYASSDVSYLYVWEAESMKGYDATTYEAGDVYTQPWEAWMVDTPHYPPPISLPSDFAEMIFIAYDRDRIDPRTKKEIMQYDDSTWKTDAGEPVSYWRDAENNNWIRIYPLPTLTWQDSEDASGDPDEAEYGSDTVDVDDNIVLIYRTEATDLVGPADESSLPEYMQKYVEYGVAERALRANTEGRIESLADYWGMRKKAGIEVVKKWKRLKMADRTICFKTRTNSGIGERPRHPRLPSTYADPWV